MLEALFFVGFVAAITPGPDFFIVLQNTLHFGALRGLIILSGIATGWLIFLSIIYFGFTHLLQGPTPQAILSLLGGSYLIFLGFELLKKPFNINELNAINAQNIKPAGYFKGLLVNLSNPKAILFFGVLVTPFLDKDLEISIVVLLLGITTAFLSIIGLGVFLRRWITPKIFFIIDKICALLFLGFGVWLLVDGLWLVSELFNVDINP